MTEQMINIYNNLNELQQKEVIDFMFFLSAKTEHKTVTNIRTDNPIATLFGSMSASDAADLRTEKLKFAEAKF